MASLFQGSPQTATSYTTQANETPRWMQDAIYNQIQLATNVANTPYQPYELPTVAELSPLQQQAYQNVVSNQGTWRGASDAAQAGMQGMSTAGTAQGLRADQNAYLSNPNLVQADLAAGRSSFNRAGGLDIVAAAQPALNNAMNIDAVAAAQPYLSRAGAQDVVGAAQPYLSRAAAQDIVGSAQPYLSRAGAQDIVGAAQPYMGQAGATTAQSLAERALSAADPYLRASSESAASKVGQYMSPYQEGVLDVIARRGSRNLQENIMPGVSDAFVKAGQFGSSRMGEFGSRAVRDTQEAILEAQSQAAQQGYGQALNAAQTDLARQGQLAGTVGSISGADLSRILQGGAQFGNLAQTAGQLTGQQAQMLSNLGQTQGQLTNQQAQMLANLGQTQGQLTGQQAQILANLGQTTGQLSAQQMQNLTNIGQTQGQLTGQQMGQLTNLGQAQTQAGQVQQQFGLNAAQAAQQAQAADYQRQMSALTQMSNLAQQNQAMGATDVAALEAAGAAQQSQLQRELTAAQQQNEAGRLYPMQQLDWLNTQIRGMAPITPQITSRSTSETGGTYSASPLSQLASGLAVSRGLQNI
jgi:hypothetical protein